MDIAAEHKVYEFDDFRIDVAHLMLYHRGTEIAMVPKAVETLLALIERRGKIVSKEELLEAVWPDTVVEESNLFLYLSLLRKTLGTQNDGSQYVETLRRRGYRFNGEVHLVEEAVEDKNHELPVDEFEQSRANIQSQSARLHVVKNWNRNTTESGKISSASSVLPALIPFESSHDLTPSKNELAPDELSRDLEVSEGTLKQATRLVSDTGGIGRWTSDSKPRRERRSSKRSAFAAAGVIAAIAIAVLAFGYSYFDNQRPIDSIAVMPFVNESGNPELEYLSDGMTESLINSLSQLPQLNVKARSSVFRYKGKEIDAATIGRELNVQAILNGRVVQRGDGLTLYLELVDAQTGNRIWGDQYIRKQTDIISLQSEIARNVVDKLKVKLSGADEQKLAKNYTENVEAYQLFLNGRFHHRKLTPPEIKKGIAYLQQAIDTDPSYALAYTEISRAYTALALAGDMNPGEVLLKAKAAAQRAVEIDDALAEAHSSLGSVFFWYDWNWKEAEEHFIRALELDPKSSIAHFGYADFLSKMGRPEEALAEIKRAREIEPFSPFINTFEAWFLAAGQPDAALDRVEIAIDLDPNFFFAHWIAAEIYKGKKMYPESIAESRLAKSLSPHQTWSDVGLAYTFAETGRVDESRAILNEMLRLSESRWVPPYHIALVYNALGETNQALAWLEKGYKHHDPKMALLKEERWNNLRDDPRFQDLLRRVGF